MSELAAVVVTDSATVVVALLSPDVLSTAPIGEAASPVVQSQPNTALSTPFAGCPPVSVPPVKVYENGWLPLGGFLMYHRSACAKGWPGNDWFLATCVNVLPPQVIALTVTPACPPKPTKHAVPPFAFTENEPFEFIPLS